MQRAETAHLQWPLAPELSESRLRTLLFPKITTVTCATPDWTKVSGQMSSHKHLTLEQLWQEYKTEDPGGYAYSRYCVLYRRWRKQQEPVMRQQHTPGERVWVDWAGDSLPILKRLRLRSCEDSLWLHYN